MNSNKTIKVEAFCSLFKEFLNELIRIYPNDNSLKLLYTTVNAMIFTIPETLVLQFMSCCSPYSLQILNKDESFFINSKLVDETSWVQDEINKVKELWPTANSQTKQSIWKYFINFIKLGNSILAEEK